MEKSISFIFSKGTVLSIIFSFAGSAILSTETLAAVPKPQVAPSKILQGSGSMIGGVAGTGFSLLDLRKSQDNKKKIERIVFDIGTIKGQPNKGLPGYYHAQLLQNPDRLVLDFSQMPVSKLNLQAIQKRLASSMYVKSTRLAMDPVDQSMNIVMYLKNKPKAKIFQVPGQKSTSKVVVDLIL